MSDFNSNIGMGLIHRHAARRATPGLYAGVRCRPGTAERRRMRRGRWSWAPEGLESRCLLAATVYTVNLTTDNGPAAGQGTGTYTGDLRYCINLANANKNTAGSEIQFDPKVFASPQT